MINFLYMYTLMLFSLINLLFSLMFLSSKKTLIIKWFLFSMNNWNLEFILIIDWMTLMFIYIVMFISSIVMIYSKEYMIMELKIKYFTMILMMFVISMIFMIISPNILSIILGWDGLGLISYCLIIYYQNNSSFNSGLLTLLSNRIGDIMLLMMIYLMMNMNSWNLMIFKFNNYLFFSFLLLMCMTKSAQIPFSMWLPAAMAAPTPVSSLVHSSTLVTAGIYLLIRFNKMFIYNKMNFIIMIIGLLTMLISSINALIEFDLKKIIAFSTLSQLGLMMLMLSMNLNNYVFFHLICHAMFKSLMFLCSGVLIHFMLNSQDIRFMGSLMNETPLILILFNFANLSLCGLPFLSGFYSKDILYEMMLNFNINLFIYFLSYLCISLTCMYSIRLFLYLITNINQFFKFSTKIDNKIMSFSILLLFMMTLIFGNLMNWLIFNSINLSIINFKMKITIYFMMMISLSIFILMNLFNLKKMLSIKSIIINLSMFMMLSQTSLIFNKPLIKSSIMIIFNNEILWNEFYSKFKFMFLFFKMNLFIKYMFKNLFINILMLFSYMFMYYFIQNI